VPNIARTISQSTQQHHHSALHLHFAVSAPQRAERTAAAIPRTVTTAAAMRQLATHTERRYLTLHHLRTDTSHVQHHFTSALARRIDRVYTVTTTNVAAPPARRTLESPSTPSTVAMSRAPEVALPAPHPRHRAPLTLATPPKESRAAAAAQPAGNKPLRALTAPPSLVWRQPPAPASEEAEERADLDSNSPSAPSRTGASVPTSAAAIPATMPQQVREAVRANLLDGAVAERLADDVIRRVEKRLRIERERRGL
jgi:hypothetical protein